MSFVEVDELIRIHRILIVINLVFDELRPAFDVIFVNVNTVAHS